MKQYAVASTPEPHVWQVRIQWEDELGKRIRELPTMYLPAKSYKHALRIANAINEE